MRVGIGFDVHRFGGPGPVILGGVSIEHQSGLEGHSDADVVSHAVIDALLGAAGLGDIGEHFPESDQSLAGASSIEMLEKVRTILADLGLGPGNVDITVIATEPRLAPMRGAIAKCIAAAIGADETDVNVKATTTDRLGFTGRGEGIAAMAVATVVEMP